MKSSTPGAVSEREREREGAETTTRVTAPLMQSDDADMCRKGRLPSSSFLDASRGVSPSTIKRGITISG